MHTSKLWFHSLAILCSGHSCAGQNENKWIVRELGWHFRHHFMIFPTWLQANVLSCRQPTNRISLDSKCTKTSASIHTLEQKNTTLRKLCWLTICWRLLQLLTLLPPASTIHSLRWWLPLTTFSAPPPPLKLLLFSSNTMTDKMTRKLFMQFLSISSKVKSLF